MNISDVAFYEDVHAFKLEGRHGLAHLARYRHARRGNSKIPPATLEYLDLLADAFLRELATGKTNDIRAVVQEPALGLKHPKSHRPKARSKQGRWEEVRNRTAFRAALHRAELVASGVAPTDADARTRCKFGYADESVVRRATRQYREAAADTMKKASDARRWNRYWTATGELYHYLEPELIAACRVMDDNAPQIELNMSGGPGDFWTEHGPEDPFMVTFPPRQPSLRNRLRNLDTDAKLDDIGAICAADTHKGGVKGWRKAMWQWRTGDRHAFALTALNHLRSLQGDMELASSLS